VNLSSSRLLTSTLETSLDINYLNFLISGRKLIPYGSAHYKLVMPVTTRHQSRRLAQPNSVEKDDGNRSENTFSGSDNNDVMGTSFAELSLSQGDDDGGDYASQGSEHELGLSEDEGSDSSSDFGDYVEGILHSRRFRCGRTHLSCTRWQTGLRLPWRNAAGWIMRRRRPRNARGVAPVTGSRAGCKTCWLSRWTFFLW